MSNKSDSLGPGSRIIRERAMNVLRETRAKIDPRLLAAMKETLTSIMPNAGGIASESPKPVPSVPTAEAKAVYPAKKFEEAPEIALTEPVDKQKIAQIVLQYMKNREDKQKH
jgi:hypothetical protein